MKAAPFIPGAAFYFLPVSFILSGTEVAVVPVILNSDSLHH